jgi:acetyltransferase-like isoleucine patch superfamily enzyme
MEILFGLLGLGGFAREVMPFAIRSVEDQYPGALVTAYFVDASPTLSFQNGTPVTSDSQFLKIPCDERLFNVAVSDSELREKLADQYIGAGAKPIILSAGNSTCDDANEIGMGAIFCGNSMVTSNAKIGRFFHSNMYSYVAHDCIIGDYVTFAPRVSCNGNVHIHDHA